MAKFFTSKVTPEEKLERVKVNMIIDQPFFGRLACSVNWEISDDIPTACTDGERVIFGKELLDTLTDKELEFVAVHELEHIIKKHHLRMLDKKAGKWNKACDYQINDELKKCGFTVPKFGLLDPKLNSEMLEEQIYNELPEHDDDDDYVGYGGVMPSPHAKGSAEAIKAEQIINTAIEVATQYAKERGNLPGPLAKYSKLNKKSIINWKDKIRRFMSPNLIKDVSWFVPNRRMLIRGEYFPGHIKEGVGRICIAVDTSGSITTNWVHHFMAEMEAICSEALPEKTFVYYFNTEVWRRDEFNCGDVFQTPKEIKSGGTYITPVIEAIEENHDNPSCLIILSDLYIEDIKPPSYPVLAICTTNEVLPFGETVNVNFDK